MFRQARDPDSLSVILHFRKSYLCLGRQGIQTRYLSVILHFWKSDLCLGKLGIQTRYPLSFTSENLICVWAGWNPLIPCISYRLESEQTFTAWYAGYNIRVKGQFECQLIICSFYYNFFFCQKLSFLFSFQTPPPPPRFKELHNFTQAGNQTGAATADAYLAVLIHSAHAKI